MKLHLRVKARQDLEDILDYSVTEHGDLVAEDYLRGFGAAFDRLLDHPAIGAARPDLHPAMRSYSVGEHRVYYLLLSDRISIVRVLHKAMDVPRHI